MPTVQDRTYNQPTWVNMQWSIEDPLFVARCIFNAVTVFYNTLNGDTISFSGSVDDYYRVMTQSPVYPLRKVKERKQTGFSKFMRKHSL